jgi:hypothetical protein
MGRPRAKFKAPEGEHAAGWWMGRVVEARARMEGELQAHIGKAKAGLISWPQVVRLLRLAYWRINRDLYDYDESDLQQLERRTKGARECA